ncbi:MAG: glycoside hydrolase family 18 protein [Cyclobacteriaceae bacterium]|nr:glycoside hydrolase family 18 protein [Cyclobacteriaceae bacterium]
MKSNLSNLSMLSILLFLFVTACNSNKESSLNLVAEHQKVVVAYVHNSFPDWGENYERLSPITHINFAFANVNNGTVSGDYEETKEKLAALVELKKIKPDLAIIISLGGWGWSGGFSDASFSENSRTIFTNSAVDFLIEHQLDGIDIDWEYPGQTGNNNTYRPEDKQNFTKVLAMLKVKLDSLSDITKQKYWLTIATGANENWINNTEMDKVGKIVDLVNLMTYDFKGEWSENTGHHSNLFDYTTDSIPSNISSDQAVQKFINAGVPANKLTLGVPFYARFWKGVENSNKIFESNYNGKAGAYSWLKLDSMSKANTSYHYYWDSTAHAPYFWSEDSLELISFENETSLYDKTKYIHNKNLAGIMFWQYTQDNGRLISAINEGLKKK